MTVDGLIVTAAAITVVWSVFSCVFGVLVAKSIRLADDRNHTAHPGIAGTEQEGRRTTPP